MNKIKKYIVLLLVAILCMNVNVPVVHAENITLYISVSSSQVNVGDSITVTVSYSYSGSFAADFQLSWSGPVSYSGGSIPSGGVISVMGNGSSSATFTATGAGTASFSVSGAGQDIISEADLGVASQGASVTIVDTSSAPTTQAPSTEAPSSNDSTQATTEDDGRSNNAYLYSLKISPGKLDPEFSPYTTTYSAQVDENVKKITVDAQADDSNADVSVWGANELELGENLVQVSVTAENGDVRYYDIHVLVGEDVGTPFTTIDGKKYSFVDYEDDLEPLEDFSSTTLKYEKWEVLAYESPNGKLKVAPLYLEDGDAEEYEWYTYLESENRFIKYYEHSAKYNRYVILNVPEGVEIPEGYVETALTINDNKITAYEPDKNLVKDYDPNNRIYLVYAMNLTGDEGFYNYDLTEGTFMRFNPLIIVKEEPVVATPTEATPVEATPTQPVVTADQLNDDGFFTKDILFYILCGTGGVLLIFIIVTIVLGCKNRNLKDELEEAESMVHQLAGTEMPDKKSKKNKDTSIVDVDLFDGRQDISSAEINAGVSAPANAIDEAINDAMVSKTIEQEFAEQIVFEQPVVEQVIQDNQQATVADIPQIEDVDYAKQSEDINNMIKENYDADKDSAF